MTVHEAVQLVLQAAAIGEHGHTLILDMGNPVRIADVAQQLIDVSGKRVDIVYVGLRPGEKIDEILTASTEEALPTGHELIVAVAVSGVPTEAVREFEASRASLDAEMRRIAGLQVGV